MSFFQGLLQIFSVFCWKSFLWHIWKARIHHSPPLNFSDFSDGPSKLSHPKWVQGLHTEFRTWKFTENSSISIRCSSLEHGLKPKSLVSWLFVGAQKEAYETAGFIYICLLSQSDQSTTWQIEVFGKHKHGLFPSLIELDDGKVYRNPLYLMAKTMVSCRFSLKHGLFPSPTHLPPQWRNAARLLHPQLQCSGSRWGLGSTFSLEEGNFAFDHDLMFTGHFRPM